MKSTKQILSAISALVLAGSLMTGCMGQSTETAEQSSLAVQEETAAAESTDIAEETEPAETDASESSETDEEEPVELSEKEIKEAQKILEAFFDGCIKEDADAILKSCNLGDAMQLYDGEDYADEDVRESAEELFGTIKEYKITNGESRAEDLVKYHESVAEILTDIEEELAELSETEESEEGDAEYRAEMELVKRILRPIDGLAVFTVDLTDPDGETTSEKIYLFRTDGKWTVDLMIADALIGSSEEDTDYSGVQANSVSKSVYNAVNTALVDMDTTDFPIAKIGGKG